MAAPSKNFSAPTDGQVDADSPLDTTLLTQIRDALIHLEEWLGMSYTAAQDHDHDGANSKGVTNIGQSQIASSAVGQAQLKTTTGAVSTGVTANIVLPGGSYGFYPQIKHGGTAEGSLQIYNNANLPSSYTTYIAITYSAGSTNIYAQQRYIQASPPYKIGDKVWGHFLFLLRDIATGTVRSAYEAEDPPWAYNGKVWLPKDDPDRLAEVPHPFADYWTKDPTTDGLEIVLVDLSERNVKQAKTDLWKEGKGLLEDIPALVPGKGKAKAHADYLLPNIERFTDKVKIVTP